jgi:hypothetical protein
MRAGANSRIPEAVIAEKFQAMVLLGRANSLMKDFYDIWLLSRSLEFPVRVLARAIAATFKRRKTDIPEALPDALTRAFAVDAAKQRQWTVFVDGIEQETGDFPEIVAALAAFPMPYAEVARKLQE